MLKDLQGKIKIWVAANKVAAIVVCLIVSLGVFLAVGNKFGSWIESYQQAKFDEKEQQYLSDLEKLKLEKDEWEQLALEAQAREQIYATQVSAIRNELEKGRLNIQSLERQLSQIDSKYLEDKEFIDKAKHGLISKYELCTRQCADSAKLGYPCASDFCGQFK